jgi:starch phosphorylase
VRHKLLAEGEPYFHVADLPADLGAHAAVADLDRLGPAWTERAVLNVARCGQFSDDRTIWEYARDIWNLAAVPPDGDEGYAER